MTMTPKACMQPAYSISTKDRATMHAWMSELVRPSILICAPVRDVGEHELVRELAEASYRLQGFHDARRRHFISRRYPRTLSDASFARFCDQPFDVSEVSDGFRGVDCIDVSDWLDCRNLQEDMHWQRFVSYIRNHPETDFVFVTYGSSEVALGLATDISSLSGNAVLNVYIDYPTPEMLADAFVAQNPGIFASHRDSITAQLSEELANSPRVSYSLIRAAAVAAAHSILIQPDAGQAIKSALGRATRRPTGRTLSIGFAGGDR